VDKGELIMDIEQLQKEVNELKARIERLGEALNNALTHCIDNDVNTDRFNQMISEALEETPAKSLNHIKAQVEEETIQADIEFLDDMACEHSGNLNNRPRKYKEQSNED